MRIALLHTRLSGYLAACLREFKRRSGAELLIYAWPNQVDAPFDPAVFADLGEIRNRREHSDSEIADAVRSFRPDALLVSGWADKGYVKICKEMRKLGVPVISGCDTQWKGTLRQHLAGITARFHVQKAIDVLWVTGERQATLARALGYDGERLWDGYYACDWARFARESVVRGPLSVVRELGKAPSTTTSTTTSTSTDNRQPTTLPLHRQLTTDNRQPHFLFVGRYAPEKGLDTLVAAYARYREQVAEPWALRCAGAGPLRESLIAAGAEDVGFVQPNELPALMRSASAFVLPSRFEPWGVVVQEAAASGLPLILSNACGAGVHLLRDKFNGFSFPAGDANALAERMVRMSGMDEEKRAAFGENGFQLSRQYTPERWAETLLTALR
jgi:glycosyltransferase involved in cell wall biosynthesis